MGSHHCIWHSNVSPTNLFRTFLSYKTYLLASLDTESYSRWKRTGIFFIYLIIITQMAMVSIVQFYPLPVVWGSLNPPTIHGWTCVRRRGTLASTSNTHSGSTMHQRKSWERKTARIHLNPLKSCWIRERERKRRNGREDGKLLRQKRKDRFPLNVSRNGILYNSSGHVMSGQGIQWENYGCSTKSSQHTTGSRAINFLHQFPSFAHRFILFSI